jgi:O-antigen ligase
VFFYSRVSKKLLNVLSFFISIILIASISSLFNDFILFNWIKDLAYFSRPLLAILAGFFISKKIGNFKSVLKIVVFVSFFFAIIHIFKIVFFIDFNTANVSKIRGIGGISNEIEVFALVILIASEKYKNIKIINNQFYKKIVLIIFSISFLLYLSRTMMITLIIFLLGTYGYLKITRKSVKYALILLFSFGLFYGYLFSREFERSKPGIESFLYKMKIAPAEIFTPVKSLSNKSDAYLWDHWRAYEATMAITQINTTLEVIIGKGFGSLVDLKFKAPIGEQNMRYIPILHNGYVSILLKSGILGLLFYLALLVSLYLFCFNKTKDLDKKIVDNLISGISVHFLFTSLIVTGMYNIMEPYVFILGMLLSFSLSKQKIVLEK